SCANVRSPLMAATATFALKAGVWFRRARLCIVSPGSQATACPQSGRNSTYRPVQISEASSPSNTKIGQIMDVLVSPDGKVDTLIVGVGGFLGAGEKDVAVGFNAIQKTVKDNKI